MAYEIPEGKGTLFPNDFKVSDTHPDYRGTMKWKGEVIAISVWKGETQAGAEKLSIKLSEPRQKGGDGSFTKPDNSPKPPQRKFAPVEEDEQIPF